MPPTFDQAELLERVDHDRAFLAETVAMLATDGRGLMQEIRRALDAGDPAAVSRGAHALKGMISNFCAPAAHDAALAVERASKADGATGAVASAAATLGERLEALIDELQRFIEGGP